MQGMNANDGTPLVGDAHLLQSVTDILQTPVGSRCLCRDYGSELPRLIDAPKDNATRSRVVAATAIAINRWEPRLQVVSVAVTFAGTAALSLTVNGINRGDGGAVHLSGITVQ